MEIHKYIRTYFDSDTMAQTWTCSKCKNEVVIHDSLPEPIGFDCQGRKPTEKKKVRRK